MDYNHYQCPVCREHMQRDIRLFLDHTHRHILDVLREGHPEWSSSKDSYEPYERYMLSEIPRFALWAHSG